MFEHKQIDVIALENMADKTIPNAKTTIVEIHAYYDCHDIKRTSGTRGARTKKTFR